MEFRLSIIHQNPSGHTNPYGVSKRVHELAFGIIICPGHVPIARRVACPPRPAPSTARCHVPSPRRVPVSCPSGAARSPRSGAATRREHHAPRAAPRSRSLPPSSALASRLARSFAAAAPSLRPLCLTPTLPAGVSGESDPPGPRPARPRGTRPQSMSRVRGRVIDAGGRI